MKGRTNTGGGGGAYTLINVNTTDFIGKVVRCSDGGSYNKQTTFNADGFAKFKVLMKGTYNLTVTEGGKTYTETVYVEEIGATYEATLNAEITLTLTVKSCPADTVYYYVNGVKTTLATTGSNGNASGISLTVVPNAEITFYSTIAKSQSNVSQPYSDTFTLTADTTEINLVPSGAVYWYGLELHTFIEFKSGSCSITKQTNSFYLSANVANAYCAVNFQPWGEGTTSGLRVKYYADHTSGIMSDTTGKNPKVQINHSYTNTYGSKPHRIFYGGLTEVTGYNYDTVYAIWLY